MEYWINKIAFIPNCEEGIGIKIAETLVEARMTVIGFCKTYNAIKKLMFSVSGKVKEKLFLYQCDFSTTEGIQTAFYNALKAHGCVDVLVNNCNCKTNCIVSTSDLKVIKQITDENISATIAWIRLAAGSMIERKTKGHIITIREQGKPCELKSTVRAATDAAIESVNDILRHEFRYLQANIKTTHINFCAEGRDFNVVCANDVENFVKLALDTPEHLQIHEMQIDTFPGCK